MRRHTRWLGLVIGAALTGTLMLPSSASHVVPTRVEGNPNCAAVSSTAPHSFKIDAPQSQTYTAPTGVTFQLTLTNGGKSLAYTIGGGAAAGDVIVKGGPAANHYDYMPHPGPQTSDTGLTAPASRPQPQISHIEFCYWVVPPITLSGIKYEDLNLNRIMDGNDSRVANWVVAVFDDSGQVASATTGSDGTWSVTVPAGGYTVCELGPADGATGLADLTGQSAPNNNVCSEFSDFPGGYPVSSSSEDLDFGDYREVQLACGQPTEFGEAGGTQGFFTRLTFDGSTTCAAKGHATDIFSGDQVVFLPETLEGTAVSTYSGTITLVKDLQNPIPALRYDQDVLDGVDDFENVPTCDPLDPLTVNSIPLDHTWCIAGVDVSSSGDQMTIKWFVFGKGDPKFR